MVSGIGLLEATDRQGLRGTMKKNRPDLPTPADELKNAYDIFIEVMENPSKANYIASINDLEMTSKIPFDLRLFDKKNYLDWKIRDLMEEILEIIHFK